MKEKNYSFLTFIRKTVPLFLMLVFVNVGWGQETWNKLTNHTDVSDTGSYMIVDVTSGRALINSNGTTAAPTAVDVSANIDGNTITGSIATNLQWAFEKSGANYIIRPKGSTTNVLYSTSTNNGVRVGTNSANIWTLGIVSGTYKGFKHVGTSRFVGVYNDADWRGYTTSTGNIADTQIEIFKLVESVEPAITVSSQALSDFSYVFGNGPSDTQTFKIGGENLDGSAEVLVGFDNLNSDFQMSIDGITFDSNLSLSAYSGEESTIYVRLQAGKVAGNYTDIIIVSGYNAPTVSVALSGTVTAPPSIPVVTAENLTGTFGQEFSHQVVASDTPDSYAISSGVLPNGITLNTITGLISGTPTQAGTYTADITATNISGTSAQAEFNFDIAKATQTLIPFVDLNKYDTDVPFLLPDMTDAGLTLVYESSNVSVATIVGDEVTITGIGTTTISAVNAGDPNWNAFSESSTLTVTEAPELYNGLGVFKLVTSLADVTDGYYVITNEANTFVMTNGRSGTATGGYFLSEAITPVDTKITNPVTANVWKIETNGSGKTIYNEITGKYVGWSAGNAASIEDVPADSNRWIFTYSDDRFTVNNVATSARQLSFNSGSPRFAAYGNANQQELQLYKLSVPVTWDGIAWSNTTGPDATLDAVITGDYTTATNLSAKSLTVTSGIFTVTTGTTLTVANAIVNNAGAANFIVENDAVVLQGSDVANTGVVTVNRNSNQLWLNDYTLWSSPVVGQNLRAFSPQTLFNRFYSYDTAEGVNGDYFQEIVTTADMNSKMFTDGKGYLIRMPNNWVLNDGSPAVVYNGAFKGTLQNGDVSMALSGAKTRYNLVGNPYPSPIDITAFYAANNANIETGIYFWRKTNAAVGSGYIAYNLMGGNDPAMQMDNIQTGQGFFVVANSAAPGALVFNNAMRTNSGTTNFYKSGNETIERHRFWLTLSNTTAVVSQMLVGYTPNATQDVDNGFDAKYFNDSPLALTSLINNDEFSIQGRGLPFTTTDIVPLGFKSDVAGTFTIALANFDGLFAGNQDIFLKDNTTGTYHNLKNDAYSFTTDMGVFNNRFQVEYNSTLGTTDPALAANVILIGVKNQQITINAGTTEMDKIELIDVSGRVIYTQEGVKATTAIIENLQVANQMLIVRISTSNNTVVNQKIIF